MTPPILQTVGFKPVLIFFLLKLHSCYELSTWQHGGRIQRHLKTFSRTNTAPGLPGKAHADVTKL